jgi:hypothetical protein
LHAEIDGFQFSAGFNAFETMDAGIHIDVINQGKLTGSWAHKLLYGEPDSFQNNWGLQWGMLSRTHRSRCSDQRERILFFHAVEL